MIILIMGLPGSGKTTMARKLHKIFNSYIWLNADEVRERYNDWDFSHEGRIRQANRMKSLAGDKNTIIDFVCPLPEMRDIINADVTIWMDTIQHGRFEDTNKIFVPPNQDDVIVIKSHI